MPWSEREALLSRAAEAIGAPSVWTSIQGESDSVLRLLIRHMDFAAPLPDDLVKLFLSSDRVSSHRDEAAVAFFNAMGVVTGPLHAGIERQEQRARDWHEALRGTPGEAWAQDLVDGLAQDADR